MPEIDGLLTEGKEQQQNCTMALSASAHSSLVKAGKMATPGINDPMEGPNRKYFEQII